MKREISVQSNYLSVPSVPCVPLMIEMRPRGHSIEMESGDYFATLWLNMNWVLGVGEALMFEIREGGEAQVVGYLPSPWIHEIDCGDITDWPTWFWLALNKINRNGIKREKLLAVFLDKLRLVILEETGKDIKLVSKEYVKRFAEPNLG